MYLSPLQPHDLPVIQKWLSDESLLHLLAVEPLDYSKPFYLFVAREGESVIGWASVFNVDLWNGKAQIGLAAPGARQKALAIVGKLLWIAFACLKLNRIAARVRSGNTIVIQALEGPLARRYGFFKEGVERQGYVRDGVMEIDPEVALSILPAGPLPEDRAYFHVIDADQMRAAWANWETAKQ